MILTLYYIANNRLFSVFVAGEELTNPQFIYLILNASLIFIVGIGLTIWKIFQSKKGS
tara:strand:- start:2224 stop:2397 length:174 start_codon:yes stop_codon:yes gene_type:complete